MNWMYKLERKYGRYAIHNLVKYLVVLNAATFAVMFVMTAEVRAIMYNALALIPSMLFKGQIWRLFTYVILPETLSPLWAALSLYLFYIIGTALERNWGAFRFNLFYFIGVLGTTLGALIVGLVMPGFPATTATYLNLSLFLAFATLFPDYELLIFFVLPVKVKWLGWLQAAFVGFTIVQSIFAGQWVMAVAPIVSLLNYLLFFGPDLYKGMHLKRRVHHNRRRFFDEVNQARIEREARQKHDDNIRRF